MKNILIMLSMLLVLTSCTIYSAKEKKAGATYSLDSINPR